MRRSGRSCPGVAGVAGVADQAGAVQKLQEWQEWQVVDMMILQKKKSFTGSREIIISGLRGMFFGVQIMLHFVADVLC
ncbi:MAG: hypothetical protein PHS20_00070 [Sphaerochaetaceae bacterium]|nr:hypothetical protein [Sphaerochaetaceae bacterium]